MADITAPGETAKLAHGAASATLEKTAQTGADTVHKADPMANPVGNPVARTMGSAMDATVSTSAGMTKQTVDAAISAADQSAERATGAAVDWTNSAAPLMDIYRDAAKRSADQMKTFFGTWMTVSKGVHDLQLKWLDTVTQTMELTGGTPLDVWQAQRRLYVTAINSALASTSRLLETASQSVEFVSQAAEVRH